MQRSIHGNHEIYEWGEVPIKSNYELMQRARGSAPTFFAPSSILCLCWFCSSCVAPCSTSVSLSLMEENLRKMTYALDGEGNMCGYDFPDHPYLYYTSPNDAVLNHSFRSSGCALPDVPRRATRDSNAAPLQVSAARLTTIPSTRSRSWTPKWSSVSTQ